MGWTGMLVVLRCVSWRLGEPCVIDRGVLKMRQLFADNSAFPDTVSIG